MPLHRLVAPLAAALLFGAPHFATAATLSVDIPGCSQVALSGSGGSYTISCTQATMTCVAQSSSMTPAGGTSATLAVACTPAATAVQWASSRDCAAPVAGAVGTASISESVGGRSCVYTATASAQGHNGAAAVAVVWQGIGTQPPAPPPAPPANAPSGCAITRTPGSGSLGTSGGAISMAASCSGGGSVTSWSWRKNASGGWSASQAPTDTLPANTGSAAVTNTYGVTACSGNACAAEVITTFTVSGSGPVGFCSQYTDVRFVDLIWGQHVDTAGAVGIVPGTLLIGRLAVPSSASSPQNIPGTISVVEHGSGQADRVMSISTQPCDFRLWNVGASSPPVGDPSGATGPMGWGVGINPNHQYLLAGDPPGGYPPKSLFTPGQTYFINLHTVYFSNGQNACTGGTCDVRITVITPQ